VNSRRQDVDKKPAGLVFKKADAEAVGVVVGQAATRGESGQREPKVRRLGRIHSQ
jgi:hypothetical protein